MKAPPARVLLVDDEAGVRFGVRDFLESRGFVVDEAQDCRGAERAFREATPDIAVIDFKLPDGDALTLMPALKAIDPSVALIVLTGHASIDLAVRAVHAGAEHFLTKPVDMAALDVMLRRLLEQQRNRKLRIASRSRNRAARHRPLHRQQRGDPAAGRAGAARAGRRQADPDPG